MKIKKTPFMRVMLLILFAIVMQACGDKKIETVSVISQGQCIVDSVTTIRVIPTLPECTASDDSCEKKCAAGQAEYCVARAYAMEKSPTSQDEAALLFRKACENGLAIGCTNYAAHIWAQDHSEQEAVCVTKMFVRSCEAGDHFACGMSGRVMMERAKNRDDLNMAKNFLESKCGELGGFSCRILAIHYEKGGFGLYRTGKIQKLLKKACDGGDTGGCGEPKTASGTFK
jgi:hypothetical protein